jgi:hypothetical protein
MYDSHANEAIVCKNIYNSYSYYVKKHKSKCYALEFGF